MVRWILIAVLSIGLVGAGIWGYKEHEEKNAVLIQAENTYQRSFHELTYHLDVLHDKIGTALAMNSNTSLSPQLVDIWRLTSDALSNVGQLPLTLLPFNKTEEFLSNIGDFTYRTAVRDLKNKPLSDKEMKALNELYKQSGEIKNELRQVQSLVLEENLRWMDVQLALATQDEQSDNTIIDGLKTVEKKVEGYAETNIDSPLSEQTTKEHKFNNLKGNDVSKQEVLNQSKVLFKLQNKANVKITKTGDGADIPLFSASYEDGDKRAYMDVSKKGGHPLSLLIERPIKEQKLSLNGGLEKAEKFLENNGFNDMTLFQSAEYDKVGVYSFLYNDNGIRVYSDSIEVKVALDNGDVLGLTARNYFMNHKKRDIPKPTLAEKDARKSVNEKVDIKEQFLAIIDNDLGEEVLTYEYLGVLGNDTYRIFINAMDGTEEKVQKLGNSELNYALAR
ncbi:MULTISPECIES: germination protein YpeB [unclassified Virgibacillus]|uniref:germination protein YpeB n=1 Tax=unclassified Virgibacillus TaxID=2620237 RepID=UPI0024DE5E43|nr:germination protein YpeB [Virgibacillus sp. LDC-1]